MAARKTVGDDKSPARWMITAIVDEKEPGVLYETRTVLAA